MNNFIRQKYHYIIIIVSGLLLYSGIIKTYAFTDAYEFLLNAKESNFTNVFIQGGRPVSALVMKLSYLCFDTVESLKFLRVFSLLISLGFSLYLFEYLKREGFSVIESLFLALIVLLSPAISIKILWSVLWIMPFVLFLSFQCGVFLLRYQQKGFIKDLIIAIILGQVVLLTYQPIFTFSLIPLFINWLKYKDFKFLLKPGLVHLSLYVLYFIIFKLSLSVIDIPELERTNISLNIGERIQWFFSGPVLKSFTWSVFFLPNGLRWIFRGIMLAAILLILFRGFKMQMKSGAISTLMLVLFLIGSYVPNIISSDSWMSYRTMDALLLIPILFIWFAISNSDLGRKVKTSIFSLFLILSFYMAFINVNNGFVDLQVAEYKAVNEKIETLSENVDTLIFIPPPLKLIKDQKLLKRVITDEFGRLSSSSIWVAEPMLRLILRSNNKSEHVSVKIKDHNTKLIGNDKTATIHVEHLFLEKINKN